jgi:hypothetical protein
MTALVQISCHIASSYNSCRKRERRADHWCFAPHVKTSNGRLRTSRVAFPVQISETLSRPQPWMLRATRNVEFVQPHSQLSVSPLEWRRLARRSRSSTSPNRPLRPCYGRPPNIGREHTGPRQLPSPYFLSCCYYGRCPRLGYVVISFPNGQWNGPFLDRGMSQVLT